MDSRNLKKISQWIQQLLKNVPSSPLSCSDNATTMNEDQEFIRIWESISTVKNKRLWFQILSVNLSKKKKELQFLDFILTAWQEWTTLGDI